MTPGETRPRDATRDDEIRDRSDAWRPTLLALGAGLAAILLLFRDTVGSMVDKWNHSQTYAHGFLIAPISAYLVWRRRRELAALIPRVAPWGLVAIAGLSIVWLLGWAANVAVVEQLAVVLMIPALVATVAGVAVVRALLFPLAYLLFAVPMGEELVPPLTEFTARFTLWAVQAVGMPVVRSGFFLHIPGQTWEVTKACSGVRYLIASVAVGCIFAYLQYRTVRFRLGFIALATVVPIFANGARAFGIVLLGYLTEGRIATGVDHIIYGWIFFTLVMLLLFWFGSLWREPERPGADPGLQPPMPRVAAPPRRALVATVAGVLAVPVATLLVAHGVARSLESRPFRLPAHAPSGSGGWTGPIDTDDDWRPRFERPAAEIREAYVKGGRRIELYAACYGRQRQGAELISSMNRVYEVRSGWRRTTDEIVRTLTIDGAAFPVIETDLLNEARGADRRRLCWQWYVVAGTATTNPYAAKWLDARALLTGHGRPSVAIAIAADYGRSPDEAAQTLADFVRANVAALRRMGDPPRGAP
ncbi:MAG: exosortase A [Hyphomicrobiales bacterium]